MISTFCPIIDENTLEETLNFSNLPVVIVWTAKWSKPAQSIALPLQEAASNYIEKIEFFRVDFDDNPRARKRYDIRCVPTVLLFINGRLEARRIGKFKASVLTAFIDSHL